MTEGPVGKETLLLGKEYDDHLREVLEEVIVGLGGRQTNESWGLGGSQVIETWDVEVNGESLTIEAETYMGLSLTGNSGLVRRVRDLVNERLRVAVASDGKEPKPG